MKNNLFCCLLSGLLVMCFVFAPVATAYADTDTEEIETLLDLTAPYVVVEGYKISNDTIVMGEDFTLTLYLKNQSTTKTAKEVLIDIENPMEAIPVYGTVTQKYLDEIAPQETVEMSFDYETQSGSTSSVMSFSVAVMTNTRSNYVKIRVPVGSDAMFNVISSNMPAENYVGLNTSASISFRVLGEDSVGNIELRVEYNGNTIGRSQVGSVTAGMTKTQSVSFVLNYPGEYALDFYLDYTSEEGKAETEFLGSKMLSVTEAPTGNNSGDVGQIIDSEVNNDNVTILLLGGLLILAIFVVAVVIIKKKR